ncbi:BON domain-containing protein [Urbifossiella limnaea]|uniref:BON domain protein n=1 Tax=Urbifossiella limnaea TaxID=2528023 RepID=A0A517XN30_9BACT|nr:BON domain-containing protein [Urbifossiella limnaea]QDU18913.1 BON domain protein [Urbifossiella limnaea]
MRNLRRLAWAVVLAATASPAAAQMGGNTGNTGGNLGTFQTPTTTGTQATTGTTGGSTGGASTAQTELATVEKAPTISAPSKYGTNSGGVIQSSNFLGPTFANPLYSGALDKVRAGTNPGGFGAVSYGTTTGARAGATTTTGGRAGSGGTFSTDPGGQLVQLPRQIAYTAQLKFAVPQVPAPRLQADLRGMIDRAGLALPAGSVQVQVDGNAVVLRGTVRDGDEARVVEGMVRLTPGVGRVTNELSFPR